MNIKKARTIGFKSEKEPFCEHCGELKLGALTKKIEGAEWCIACADTFERIPTKKIKELYELQNKNIIQFYKEAINELEKQ